MGQAYFIIFTLRLSSLSVLFLLQYYMTNTEGFELEVWVQFGLDNELCNIFKVHQLSKESFCCLRCS